MRVEIVEVLRPPRRLGNERQPRMICQRIDCRGFSGVRSAGKGNLAQRIVRQVPKVGNGGKEGSVLE
jgi:hypothetical protein